MRYTFIESQVFKSPFDVIPPGSCIVFQCIMYTSRMIEAKSYQFTIIEYIVFIDQLSI